MKVSQADLAPLPPNGSSVAAGPSRVKMSIETTTRCPVSYHGLFGFVERKLETARRELEARRQSVAAWAGGTSEEWIRAGCVLTKEQRLEKSKAHARMAVECEAEVSSFEELLAIVRDLPPLDQPESSVAAGHPAADRAPALPGVPELLARLLNQNQNQNQPAA